MNCRPTNVAVVGVNPNSGIESMDDLLAQMKANPDKITVATAGVTSGGHNAMEGELYRKVTFRIIFCPALAFRARLD